MNKHIQEEIEKFEKEFPSITHQGCARKEMYCESYKNVISSSIRMSLTTIYKTGLEEGKDDAVMEESIKRYDQAKEDGTLDKHFPVIGKARTIKE